MGGTVEGLRELRRLGDRMLRIGAKALRLIDPEDPNASFKEAIEQLDVALTGVEAMVDAKLAQMQSKRR